MERRFAYKSGIQTYYSKPLNNATSGNLTLDSQFQRLHGMMLPNELAQLLNNIDEKIREEAKEGKNISSAKKW